MDVSSHWSLIMWVWFIPSNSFCVNTALDTLKSGNPQNTMFVLFSSNFLFHVENLSIEAVYGFCVFVCVCNSSAGPGSEEEVGGNSRQRHNRHGRDGAPGSLEKRMEELEKVCFLHQSKIKRHAYQYLLGSLTKNMKLWFYRVDHCSFVIFRCAFRHTFLFWARLMASPAS